MSSPFDWNDPKFRQKIVDEATALATERGMDFWDAVKMLGVRERRRGEIAAQKAATRAQYPNALPGEAIPDWREATTGEEIKSALSRGVSGLVQGGVALGGGVVDAFTMATPAGAAQGANRMAQQMATLPQDASFKERAGAAAGAALPTLVKGAEVTEPLHEYLQHDVMGVDRNAITDTAEVVGEDILSAVLEETIIPGGGLIRRGARAAGRAAGKGGKEAAEQAVKSAPVQTAEEVVEKAPESVDEAVYTRLAGERTPEEEAEASLNRLANQATKPKAASTNDVEIDHMGMPVEKAPAKAAAPTESVEALTARLNQLTTVRNSLEEAATSPSMSPEASEAAAVKMEKLDRAIAAVNRAIQERSIADDPFMQREALTEAERAAKEAAQREERLARRAERRAEPTPEETLVEDQASKVPTEEDELTERWMNTLGNTDRPLLTPEEKALYPGLEGPEPVGLGNNSPERLAEVAALKKESSKIKAMITRLNNKIPTMTTADKKLAKQKLKELQERLDANQQKLNPPKETPKPPFVKAPAARASAAVGGGAQGVGGDIVTLNPALEPPVATPPPARAAAPQIPDNAAARTAFFDDLRERRGRGEALTAEQHHMVDNTDPLTGMENFYAYTKTAKEKGLIHGDSDLLEFKRHNDRLGEAAGDILLEKAGDVWKRAIQETGMPVRMFRRRGDEFSIVGKTDDEVRVVQEKFDELAKNEVFEIRKPDGTIERVTLKGASHGRGPSFTDAEAARKLHKKALTESGQRIERDAPVVTGSAGRAGVAGTEAAVGNSVGSTGGTLANTGTIAAPSPAVVPPEATSPIPPPKGPEPEGPGAKPSAKPVVPVEAPGAGFHIPRVWRDSMVPILDALKRIGATGNDLAKKLNLADREHAQNNADALIEIRNLWKPLSAEERKLVAKVLHGVESEMKLADNPIALQAMIATRERLHRIALEAKKLGLQMNRNGEVIDFEARQNYFPVRWDAGYQPTATNMLPGKRNRNIANSRKEDIEKILADEEKGLKNLKDPIDALSSYYNEFYRQAAEARNFGLNGTVDSYNAFQKRIEDNILAEGGHPNDVNYVKRAIAASLGKRYEGGDSSNWAVDNLRRYQATTKLTTAAIPNLSQGVNTLKEAGFVNTAKAYVQVFKMMAKGGDELEAITRTGALNDSIMFELSNVEKGGRLAQLIADIIQMAPGKIGDEAGRAFRQGGITGGSMHLTGFKHVEKLNRLAAAQAGILHAEDLAKVVAGDNPSWLGKRNADRVRNNALTELRRMGVSDESIQSGILTDEDRYNAGYRIAQDTQFSSRPETVPLLWDTSPVVRVLTQFQSFGLKQINYDIERVGKPAYEFIKSGGGKGSLKPLAVMMVSTPVAGVTVNYTRDQLWGTERPDDHYDIINNPEAYLDHSMAAGAFGLWGTAIASASRGKLIGLMGPTAGDASAALMSVYRARQQADGDARYFFDALLQEMEGFATSRIQPYRLGKRLGRVAGLMDETEADIRLQEWALRED